MDASIGCTDHIGWGWICLQPRGRGEPATPAVFELCVAEAKQIAANARALGYAGCDE
jgi:hypothetical protein